MTELMSLEDILAIATPFDEPKRSGVYFLIRSDEIVYIGHSMDMIGRIRAHISKGVSFDRWAFIPCGEDREWVERAYLDFFLPELNQDPLTLRAKGTPRKPWRPPDASPA